MQTVIAKIVEEEEMIKGMVDRFLSWQLPKDFGPDCGIEFTPPQEGSPDNFWPVGTNLLTAEQAEQMVRHMLGLSA